MTACYTASFLSLRYEEANVDMIDNRRRNNMTPASTKPKFTHSPWFSHHFHSKLSQKPIRPSNRAPPCHISTWATGILSWVNWSVQQKPCWYVDTHIPCSSIGSRTIYTCFELSVYNTVVYIYVYIHTLCINHHHISFNLGAEKVNKGCGWDAWRRSCQQW